MKRVVWFLAALAALGSNSVGATPVSSHCTSQREVIRSGDTALSLAAHMGVDEAHFIGWLDHAPHATRVSLRNMRPGDRIEMCVASVQGTPSLDRVRVVYDRAGRRAAVRAARDGMLRFAGVIGSVTTTATALATHNDSKLLITRLAPGRSLNRALMARLGHRPLVMGVADYARHEWHLPAALPKDTHYTLALVDKHASGHRDHLRLAYLQLNHDGRQLRVYPYVDQHGHDFVVGSHGRSFRILDPLTPLRRSRISSGWGWRTQPVLGGREFHHGIDYAAPPGTPIRATMAGVVVIAGWHGNYGRMVEIRHGHGFLTRYGHLRALARATHVGRHVRRGQVIGYVGTTGLSTGPHLYYEVWRRGRRIDPLRHPQLMVSQHLDSSDRRRFRGLVDSLRSLPSLAKASTRSHSAPQG